MMEYVKDIFNRTICVAVFVTEDEYYDFTEVLDKVKRYKVDRLRVGNDVIFAFKMKKNRYELMARKCCEANIPLVSYSTVRYLHRIAK